MAKNKVVLHTTTLDREVEKLARGERSVLEDKYVLQWAARTLRADRIARDAALKAAGLPERANAEFFIGVVGHEPKKPADVLELERMFALEDPRSRVGG